MNLTLEQIQSITTGAIKIWHQNDGYHFAKCTDKQIAAWYAIKETLGMRAETTTGVRLDFHTNSKTFAFKSSSGDRYDLYLDDVMTNFFVPGSLTMKQIIELDGKEHRITLVFPSHTVGVLEEVAIDDGAYMKPHTYDRKILFVGDSITQGWNTRWDSLSFAHSVSRFFNADSIIQGIGGAIFHESTFDEDLPFEPDTVCIAYGTNDWGFYENKEQLREHAKAYLDKVTNKYENAKIFGISPIWRGDNDKIMPMGTFEECCNIVKEEIKNHNMILVEGEYLVPHSPEFFDDGFLHPNDIGFGIYAQNLAKSMNK